MKNVCRMFVMLLGVLFSLQASGAEECPPQLGEKSALPKADVEFLSAFIAVVKKKDRKAFLSMSRRNLQYVHVFTESSNSPGAAIYR